MPVQLMSYPNDERFKAQEPKNATHASCELLGPLHASRRTIPTHMTIRYRIPPGIRMVGVEDTYFPPVVHAG